jgi:hypothetical protein
VHSISTREPSSTPTFGKMVTDCLTDPQQFGHRDVFLKFESREKAADARRYYRGRELFYGVRVEFEFGTEEEFIAMKDLNNQARSDGTRLCMQAPHLSETRPFRTFSSFHTHPSAGTARSRGVRPSKSSNDRLWKCPKVQTAARRMGRTRAKLACIYLGNVPLELLCG